MSRLIDTHFHLDFYKNHEKIFKDINALNQYTLCVTNSPEIYFSCKRLYQETEYVKFAVGFNPKMLTEQAFDVRNFNHAIKTSNYIGEVGLDFSKKYYSQKDTQIKIFEQIIKIASCENKLLNIHSYMAEKAVLEILKQYENQRIIIHWYTGDGLCLEELIKIGSYFSINCNMIESINRCKLLKSIPLNKILIESDGPFTKVNNKKYEPSLLDESYSLIGKALEINNIRKLVFENFRVLLSKDLPRNKVINQRKSIVKE